MHGNLPRGVSHVNFIVSSSLVFSHLSIAIIENRLSPLVNFTYINILQQHGREVGIVFSINVRSHYSQPFYD